MLLLSSYHLRNTVQQDNVTPVLLWLWPRVHRSYITSVPGQGILKLLPYFLNQLAKSDLLNVCGPVTSGVSYYCLQGIKMVRKGFQLKISKMRAEVTLLKKKLQWLKTKFVGKSGAQYSLVVWLWVFLWDWGSSEDAYFLSLPIVKYKMCNFTEVLLAGH